MHDLGLRDYLHILRRRKWIVLQALVIVPLAAVALALRQSPLYQSSADVLLRYQSLPSTVSGINDPNSYSYYVDPVRSTDTQLQVAELPLIANRVAAALRKRGVNGGDVVGSTSVSEIGDTDVLEFTATSGSATLAAQLATEYARQFTLYHQQLDTGSITSAIKGLRRRITELRSQAGAQSNKQIIALQGKIDQLQTLLTVETSSAVVIRTASGAAKIRPRPTKYGLLGLGLGLVLGIGLALLRDAFDTRLRTPDQISDVLRLPLLGRVPPPSGQLQRDDRLVMIAEPTSHGADAYRRLRMNLEFASVGKPSQVVMFTSALAKEGKSTTLGNLAVAAALAGKSVALVDLDLRRPALSRFFRLDEPQPGLSAVALGHAELDDALARVPLGALSRNAPDRFALPGVSAGGGNGAAMATAGSLAVLPSGILPPDPGEFVGLESVGRVIASLRERVDLILLDVPPLLAVGDGLTTARLADAVVVVVRSENARRKIAAELAAVLARMPTEGLGFVLCGAHADDGSGYYGYGYGPRGYGAVTERGTGAVV
jgi:Mrp family chromosome partitioning ATPase/capsular polysaccharide biosynthesis protein